MSIIATATPIICVTGVNDPFTGVAVPKIGTFPAAVQLMTLDAVPVAITGTSPITGNTDGTWVSLSSTNYDKNKFKEGRYVYAQGLVSKIVAVNPQGSSIRLDKKFPSALVAVNIFYCKGLKYKKIRAVSSGTAAAILNGVTFGIGLSAEFEARLGVAPVSYNANAANAEITFELTE